jgi:Family of unknown function (DUF5681)
VKTVSDDPASQPVTGRAKGYANIKPWKKGRSGNPKGKPKDLAKFGDILMKEFYNTVAAQVNGKTVKKMQGEFIAMQMIKGAISKGPVAQALILKFIEAHEAREARREELLLRKQLEGSTEIDWDEEKEKEKIYERLVAATADLKLDTPIE